MSKLYGIVLFLLLADYGSSFPLLNTYVYEWGADWGLVLAQVDGTIELSQPVTKIDLRVPTGTKANYVRVTINALSPPKVDYNPEKGRITITYLESQISYSTYSIVAKGHILLN
ncbi:uncharacterized protein LOC123875166 [Maniola jurtina]|uniref:uncharacterized protein LOC123875166 n=1 Tax=Maniola jurtina TaxID=191418 RepID=UPI001E6871F2|nr:uncharacterized protein LOC123875166 [Maniola jurtina]